MKFCEMCGKELADNEVCTCQAVNQPQSNEGEQMKTETAQNNGGQSNTVAGNAAQQVNMNQQAPINSQPVPPPPFVQELIEFGKAIFKNPADAVKNHVSKVSLVGNLILIAVLVFVKALGKVISMVSTNIAAEQEANKALGSLSGLLNSTYKPVYDIGEIFGGVFNTVLNVLVAIAVLAVVMMILINVLEKDKKVSFEKCLAVATLSYVVTVPVGFITGIITMIPATFFNYLSSWLTTFASAVGYVFTFIGIREIEKNDNNMPIVYGVASLSVVIMKTLLKAVHLL